MIFKNNQAKKHCVQSLGSDRKTLKIGDTEIAYKIRKNKRAKNLSLSIKQDASVVVSLPTWAPEILADNFVKEKAAWILTKIEIFKNRKPSPLNQNSYQDYLSNKAKIKIIIIARLKHYNKLYNFEYNKITIRNQKTRWGSCSSKGNLNFNYKLVHLREELINYVVVHELCHLAEMNHSQAFWNQVARAIPNHKDHRRELRQLSLS